MKKPTLTPCELAFVKHMQQQSIYARKNGTGPETILSSFHEAFEDWLAAIRWARANPREVELVSRSWQPTLRPLFLRTDATKNNHG
jgi:hypothetical protein